VFLPVTTTGRVSRAWKHCNAEHGTSHANSPEPMAIRSPQPNPSWVIAMRAVMDGAAINMSLATNTAPPEARLALRAAFRLVRTARGAPLAHGRPLRIHNLASAVPA